MKTSDIQIGCLLLVLSSIGDRRRCCGVVQLLVGIEQNQLENKSLDFASGALPRASARWGLVWLLEVCYSHYTRSLINYGLDTL